MVSLTQLPPPFCQQRAYDVVPQHPLERLHQLRLSDELRRQTFVNWPKSSPICPTELCDNGFYYMGSKDKVQCAFCGGVLSGWLENDNVASEHAKHFRYCEKVSTKLKTCADSLPEHSVSSDAGQHSQNAYLQPHNKHFLMLNIRIVTFQSWPKNLKQSPEDLASTGLYYKGTGDTCQCHMCGGILSGWEDEDIPEKEHKKWFPKCPLVNKEYIEIEK
ncbi:baculoviral IAP repeat-containing protein 7/8 [Mytilus galloprovincialis]|uniref:Baculoviral IAP repeat-containing protein 7/8 n=1 Tax=Mytilus galloprovincialis TaxID=29158 RepID=A0A8B6GRG2_MYTGA|nr:baculoviral IAP repeat-containing protein 7/8 [Mytilus galloprovincialis]